MNDSGVPAPTSIEEVEILVKELYAPTPAGRVTAVDNELRRIQLSPDGWQLADVLLGSQDTNVRFFGALTFQRKLNLEGSALDPDTAKSVLLKVLSWTVRSPPRFLRQDDADAAGQVRLVRAGEKPLVKRKLCAALATYFTHSPSLWTRPILQLAASLQHGDAVADSDITDTGDVMNQLLPHLGESELCALLLFSAALAAEVEKIDALDEHHGQLHNQLLLIIPDACALMYRAVRHAVEIDSEDLKTEVLSCFHPWVNYSQVHWAKNVDALNHLRRLVPDLIALLADYVPNPDVVEVFRDLLDANVAFFLPELLQQLGQTIRDHIGPQLIKYLNDEDPFAMPLVQLVCAYGTAKVDHIVGDPEDELVSRTITSLCLSILESPGCPGDDDEVSIHCIEFWNTYIELAHEYQTSPSIDGLGSRFSDWPKYATGIGLRLAGLLWSKMRFPIPGQLLDWTQDTLEAFREFRTDASELMVSIFLFLDGDVLVQHLIDLALQALQSRDWQALEAALFCINSLADNTQEDARSRALLHKLFGSDLFRVVADFDQKIPLMTRRTAIDILGSYGDYIKGDARYLPDALRYLFASLSHSHLTAVAAKSIALLCSACRASLTGELDGFLTQFHAFRTSASSDLYASEKVVGAIAAIIQAVTPESGKAAPLSKLLDFVEATTEQARSLAMASDFDAAHITGISALTYLASIGKNLQAPEDVPILLDDDGTDGNPPANYWQSPDGRPIQSRILALTFTVLGLFPLSGEAVDGVCSVLKSGFTETEPGPFVFSPQAVVDFIEQCSSDTPQLESVLSMAATLVVQYSRSSGDRELRIESEVTRLYQKVASIIQAVPEPSRDPSVIHGCLDILDRMTKCYLPILLDVASTGAPLKPMLDCAIQVLDGVDLMPKRAGATLWCKLMATPRSPDDPRLLARKEEVLAAYGPPLAHALVTQVAGSAYRSELLILCEPIQALLATQPRARAWLETALFSDAVVAQIAGRVTEADCRRFVPQLFAVRNDARKTRDVVQSFWAGCRGTVPRYR